MPDDFHGRAQAASDAIVERNRRALQKQMLEKGLTEKSDIWKIVMVTFEFGVTAGHAACTEWYQMYGCYP